MSQEKKRVSIKQVNKVEARKRPEPEPELPKERKPRPKATDDKFIRIADDAKIDEFRAIGERVQRGEVKWGYYALDSGKGYHHFLIINKQITT